MLTRIKDELDRFFRCERSAVTVIVTFLLIPAILVTGTGVEFARVFSNRAVAENAGELAANAALAQYDAVLQDMYGLYAIAMTDEGLAELLDAYVKAAFNEDGSMLHLSAGEATGSLNTDDANYYLSNKEILARQIQEYCKLRGIGALAEDLIDKFKIFDFSKLKVDLDIFDKKLEADDQFNALLEQYSEFYFRMRYNDYFVESTTGGVIGSINSKMLEAQSLVSSIERIVGNMQELKADYDEAAAHYEDEEELEAYQDSISEQFDEEKEKLLQIIDAFTTNLPTITHGDEHKADASKKPWYLEVVATVTGYNLIESLLQKPGSKIEYYMERYSNPDCLDSYTYNLDQILGTAQAINEQIDEFSDMQEKLEEAIEDGSDVTQATMSNQAELYKAYMNKLDIGVIQSVVTTNKTYISSYKTYLSDSVFSYGGSGLGIDDLQDKINDLSLTATGDAFTSAKGITFRAFTPPGGWGVFCQHTSDGFTGNPFADADCPDGLRDLYWTLALQYVNAEAETTKGKFKEGLNSIGKAITSLVGTLTKGVAPYPLGHDDIPANLVLPSQGTGAVNATESFELTLDNIGQNNKQTRGLLKQLRNLVDAITKTVSNAADSIVDKGLLTVYATHMFSNYATAKGESMGGYKYNAQLNYLQGAEQEYIIFGNRSGFANLSAFGGVIIVIRFFFNYASTFLVPEINGLVESVAVAASLVPVVGPALYLIARFGLPVALALGESLVDLYRLRCGESVPLIKWKTGDFIVGSPAGLEKWTAKRADSLTESVTDLVTSTAKDLIKTAVSSGDMEMKMEKAPNLTSAKALDDEARRVFDNSSDNADTLGLAVETIDTLAEAQKDYHERADKYVNEKIKDQKKQYLEEAMTQLGLEGDDKAAFQAGYNVYENSYIPNYNADYAKIKHALEQDKTSIEDAIEKGMLGEDPDNEYYKEFSNQPGNSSLLDKVKQSIYEDKFKQFSVAGIKENLKKKFSLDNILSFDYTFYSGMLILLTVSRDKVLMRTADLISLNVANKSSALTPKVDKYDDWAAIGYDAGYALTHADALANGKLPTMSQETFNTYTLDKRRVFIHVDVDYEMNWTFIALGLFQADKLKTGVLFPKTYTIHESVYRGY